MNDTQKTTLPLAIFGIPLNNADLLNLVTQCLEIIKNNKLTGQTSFLTWVDGELITKCYGLLPSRTDNPELLSLLRNADISSVSGTFLNKIGSLLGSPMVTSISPKDFLLNLLRILGENQKGVFFLSNHEKEAKSVALTFHDKFNKLRLVGAAAPPLFTEGEDLIYAAERDTLLVEQINASNADLLVINLGYPKQLLWLDRVAQSLHVPLVLTFHDDFLVSKPRIPTSFREKTKDFLHWMKLAWISAPLIFFHSLNRYLYQWFFAKKNQKKSLSSHLFLSEYRTIASIDLPECIDASTLDELNKRFDEIKNHHILIYNFQNVRHIQPEGFYFLIKTWLVRNKLNKEVYAYAPPDDIVWLMKVHRCWDLFKNHVCDSPEVLMTRVKGPDQTPFYDTFYQYGNNVVISILGSLSKEIDLAAYMKKIIPIIDLKNCFIDLNYCTYIDNAGFAFLLELRKYLHDQQGDLTLLAVNKNLRKQFKTAFLDKTFVFRCN